MAGVIRLIAGVIALIAGVIALIAGVIRSRKDVVALVDASTQAG